MPSNNEIEKYFRDNNIDISDIRSLKLLLQANNDLLMGGLRSNNMRNFRNTCVFNSQDSLDNTYPMYMHFNIIDETIKIISIKLSFWLLPFRAYDKSATSGGGATSGSGGGQTSSSTSTPSGGGSTSGVASGTVYRVFRCTTPISHNGGYLSNLNSYRDVPDLSHTHTTPSHTHPSHTHTVADHTHTTPEHTHAITFGIYEENNSPTIGFQISRDNNKTYGPILGKYTADVTNLEIKDYITAIGSYIIKFTSTARARLSAQLTAKLDIIAR